MRASILTLALLLSLPAAFASENSGPADGGSCLKCHKELDDSFPDLWKHDIHAQSGISCADCHGGDPTSDDQDTAMSKKAGFKGAPKRAEIPNFCGRCHGDAVFIKKYSPLLPVDQLEKYWTSVHGQRIRKGDQKVAQCVSCHGNHGIRKVNDSLSPVYPTNLPKMCSKCHSNAEYMAEYKIPTNQYDDYVQSVHGKAVLEKGDVRGGPVCNTCHGNHGATPPGLSTIANVCGSCHRHNADLFLGSPMAKPLSAEPLGECIACHGKHKIMHTSDDLVGNQVGAVCTKCHSQGQIGGKKGAEFAAYVSEALTGYKKEMDRVTTIVKDAGEKGMDVTEGTDALQAARQSLIQARTELHGFARPAMDAKFKEGSANLKKAEIFGLEALKEFTMRRLGLAISTILLTLVVIGLALVIRSLPPKNHDSDR